MKIINAVLQTITLALSTLLGVYALVQLISTVYLWLYIVLYIILLGVTYNLIWARGKRLERKIDMLNSLYETANEINARLSDDYRELKMEQEAVNIPTQWQSMYDNVETYTTTNVDEKDEWVYLNGKLTKKDEQLPFADTTSYNPYELTGFMCTVCGKPLYAKGTCSNKYCIMHLEDTSTRKYNPEGTTVSVSYIEEDVPFSEPDTTIQAYVCPECGDVMIRQTERIVFCDNPSCHRKQWRKDKLEEE